MSGPQEDKSMNGKAGATALSNAQGTSVGRAFALGPNGNRFLNEELTADERPTPQDRVLEIALLWGDTVIDVRTFKAGSSVKIGPRDDAQFRLYDESVGEGFELVTASGNEFAIHGPPGARMIVRKEGRERPASGDVTLAIDERALVDLGTTHLVLRWIKPAKQSKTGFFDSADFYFTKVLSVVFLAHLVLLIGFWITPLNNELLSEDLFKNPSNLVKTIIKAPEKKKLDLSGVKEGAKPKDKEGKFGKKEAKKEEAQPSKKGAPIVDPKKREDDRQKIAKAGLLKALNSADGAVSNIFGPGGIGTGLNNALGGLKGGAGMGDAHGVGGLGSRGTGPGGGGTGLGIGGLGTKGSGRGRGGYGDLDLGGRGKGETRIVPGRTIVQGSLSKDIIAKIVRQHQNEIKYCYEQELNKNPNLYGKVSVAFTIDGTGDVSDATVNETTMNNPNVENCMSVHIRRWKFPEPKGGGQVFVTYPWLFKASGSDE
jgi:outer membrane biosynthesis protein TonB